VIQIITYIKKRDGRIVLFNKGKITKAVFKAAQAVGGSNKDLAEQISDDVVQLLEGKFRNRAPSIEDVQDCVEKVLIERGHAKTAKAYILYRDRHSKIRRAESTFMDINDTMKGYLKRADWRVKENANVDYSVGGLILYISGKVTADYWLNHIYPPYIGDAHRAGDIHLHDLNMFTAYCAGWSLRQLLREGFGGVPGRVQTVPAKHMNTVIGQMVNFLGTLQNEWAGAQAFSSVDTYLAPFVKYDNLSYKEVKQQIQRLLFNLATPSRWGTQTPFTNFTFDWIVPEDMKDQPVIVGGKYRKEHYRDFQDEMDMVNRAFIECMTEGDANGRIFTYPIPTYNITKDFDWDSENANMLFEMTAKYGLPYFQNFINSDLKPSDVRSMCCRLQLNLAELRSKTGGLFGSGENTGSVGVVTINMPRIGYLAKDDTEFFGRLGRVMDVARDSLEIKRDVVTKYMNNELLPYTKRYLGSFGQHFSTIGLNGMNEACINFLGENIATDEGKAFALRVLDFMRNRIKEYQEETGHIYNLEATPAEGVSYRLPLIDKKKYPAIIHSGAEEPYYTNSTQLPVGYTDDIFEALAHQDDLQCKYTGGTVFHGFLGERINDLEACKKLVRRIAYNFRLPYFTITPTFSVCRDHGYLRGEQRACPSCGKGTEVYSRVVGFHRPVRFWNKGKQEEFKERKVFNVEKCLKNQVYYDVYQKRLDKGFSENFTH